MSVTTRDRKLLLGIAFLAILAGYWFLLLGPKRDEAGRAAAAVEQQRDRRDSALARVHELEAARSRYAADYTAVVRLGKAVPSFVDTPSLIVQLQSAARDTDIDFDRIAAGERAPAPGTAPGGSLQTRASNVAQQAQGGTAAQAGASFSPPAAPGTRPTPGPDDPRADVRSGREDTPAAREARRAPQPTGPAVPGLERVPLDFTFRGSFFELADFFHEMKRFVFLADGGIRVRGRLMTIDELTFSATPEDFPRLTAEISSTVYVTPKGQMPAAGATPEGPPGTQPASDDTVPTTPSTEPGSPPVAVAP